MSKVISWYGGKQLIAKDIINHFPPHHTYCEIFGGGAHVLLNKRPSLVEIYNDINQDLVNLFKILRDKSKSEKLIELLKYTPYAKSEYIFYLSAFGTGKSNINGADEPIDDIERARRFYTKIMQSYAGNQRTWG